jgi:hypothetical protein
MTRMRPSFHNARPGLIPKDLGAYTDEELKQALARVLAHARGEVLNDTEVQKFWQLHKEIQRRRAPSGTARSLTDLAQGPSR